jgi:hypothetical protein
MIRRTWRSLCTSATQRGRLPALVAQRGQRRPHDLDEVDPGEADAGQREDPRPEHVGAARRPEQQVLIGELPHQPGDGGERQVDLLRDFHRSRRARGLGHQLEDRDETGQRLHGR